MLAAKIFASELSRFVSFTTAFKFKFIEIIDGTHFQIYD